MPFPLFFRQVPVSSDAEQPGARVVWCVKRRATAVRCVVLGPGMPVNLKTPNLGPRLTIVDAKGKRIARLGGENGPGLETGKFLAPHGIALDSKGDIYLGEVGVTNWNTSFPDTPMPAIVRCLQKLEKI